MPAVPDVRHTGRPFAYSQAALYASVSCVPTTKWAPRRAWKHGADADQARAGTHDRAVSDPRARVLRDRALPQADEDRRVRRKEDHERGGRAARCATAR